VILLPYGRTLFQRNKTNCPSANKNILFSVIAEAWFRTLRVHILLLEEEAEKPYRLKSELGHSRSQPRTRTESGSPQSLTS
jgi:hypothetical protein